MASVAKSCYGLFRWKRYGTLPTDSRCPILRGRGTRAITNDEVSQRVSLQILAVATSRLGGEFHKIQRKAGFISSGEG